jgi:ABC-2 type transport system ATP-binding protein
MENAVKIDNLSVVRGGTVAALKDISLTIPQGKITGFIGPSGAGKTTLIKSIVGRLKVPRGKVMVLGKEAGSPALRQTVTYMAQELSVYSDLTVRENLLYFAKMRGQTPRAAQESVQEVLQLVDLPDKATVLVSDLSGGQKQRVSLAVALLGTAKIMVLDEPTVGLDPMLRGALWQLFNKIAASGVTIIISSHSMDEAKRCENLILLREGKVIAHNSPAELLRKTATRSVEEAFLRLVESAP